MLTTYPILAVSFAVVGFVAIRNIYFLSNFGWFQAEKFIFCIPESFATNISQQFFLLQNNLCEFTSQHKNINSKGDFVLKKI